MISAPLAIAGITSFQTDSTCLPAGSMVMIDVSALDGSNRTLGNISAVGLGLIARGRHQIERGHLVAGLDQIGRHRPAHIAEANECDICHLEFLRFKAFLFDQLNFSSSAPISAK